MERLTNRDGVWRERMDSERINRLYKQLSAYENTGFTPEDFDELCRFMSETRIALGFKTFDELRKAVEDGVIIRLPCKIGDKVYRIEYIWDDSNQAGYVVGVAEKKFHLLLLGEFGKTVFCTREEAEAALVKETYQK